MAIVRKKHLPRSYPDANFLKAEIFVENQIGLPIKIRETKQAITISFDTKGKQL